MPLPYPNKIYRAVTEIEPEWLWDAGIRGVLLDIDGTLMQTRDKMPEKKVMDWISALKNAGIAVYILSNNKHKERVRAFAETIGADWTYLAHKPKKKGFFEASEKLGIPFSELAAVGDQIFTDIYGAKRCGIKGILVHSIDTYLWYYPLRHIFELFFMKEKN